MKFSVNNLGPIISADIEFDNSVVIVGPNSSGKTFLSTAFYLINSSLSLPIPILPKPKGPINFKEGISKVELNTEDFVDEEAISEYFKRATEYIFNSSPQNLITIGEDKCVIENDNIRLIISSDGSVKAKIKDYKKVSIEIEYKEVSDPHFCTYNISNKIIVVGNLECLRQAISNFAFRAILTNEELLPMAFLSIERVSFLSLYSLISSQIYSALLARPLALDFLKWLSPTVHEEEFYKVKLVVEHPTKIRAMIKDKEIPISLLSSGLGQLSILEFLVRNPILKSLVIEEPEINLHDDMQIKLGKYLAKNASKKMFITTHSEWFTMSFAYHLRNLRIFELREKEENLFEAKEVEVYEDGSIGELQSIHKPHDKFLNEMIENILKYGETDK